MSTTSENHAAHLLEDVTNMNHSLARTLQAALVDPDARIDDAFLDSAAALLDALHLTTAKCNHARLTKAHSDDYRAARHALRALSKMHGTQPVEEVPVIRVEGDVTAEQVAQIVEAHRRGADVKGRRLL